MIHYMLEQVRSVDYQWAAERMEYPRNGMNERLYSRLLKVRKNVR